MLRAAKDQPDPEGPGTVVILLDWFQLDQVLILVQERPVDSVDLLTYMRNNGRRLPEQDAKVCGGQPAGGFSSAFMGLQGGDRDNRHDKYIQIVVCSRCIDVCVCVCVCV